ncbi:MICAL-like protein 2 Junctional Rab13-binding protein Molecule interacting with CasL-like 2 [Channa argus]|uniref:MICAL-like protein 2 Junctional Rab13-binding protein Molecule interacting with CasL-like 2 n=1 Tax=Channa argus TaxID=215402 RepID=A0A6G1PCK8_CHAAH|nr:MICAL-like protein 2 Junctional Rab13-binding protein Molecule interacting with CasL-like 2 [Channa argus]
MAAVKALQQWCRIQCEGYRDVSITNMTTSFRDGLAFCALIHKHRSDLINFDSLKKEDVYENNKLAFKVAEEELGIPALLDAEDMVALKVPDRLSILTYVSQYYNYFHGRSPIGGMAGIKRPAEGPTDEPSGKKNQPVVSKVFPSSKPARENSPPPSSNITRPSPSPRQTRNATQEVVIEKSHQTGTLSNKCVACNQHVHLVQRHLVDGKLYHRNCAKLQSPTNTTAPLRPLPTNTPIAKFTPLPDLVKTAPIQTPSRLAPTSPTEKSSTPSSFSSTFSTTPTSRPATGLSSTAKESQTAFVPKPTAPLATGATTFTTTTSIATRPTAAPRTSITAEKTSQARLKFLQSDNTTNNEEKKTTVINIDVNKGPKVFGKAQETTTGQAQTVVVNVGGAGKMETNMDKGWGQVKPAAGGGKVSSKQEENDRNKAKASAAAFLSNKLAKENNNNNSKPPWTNVALKKTDKPQSQEETPKRDTGAVKGRVKLKADPSLLADFRAPEAPNTPPSPASRSGLEAKSPDRGGAKPVSAPANISASEKESPVDWRTRLKPVAKETKPVGTSQSTKPPANGAGKSQTLDISVGPVSSSTVAPSPIISVTPTTKSEGFPKVQKDMTANGSKSNISKTRPDYIPKEDIERELQEIEDNLNELEKRGVELETKLRSSEEEGEDESLMDVLMVEWFNLIRNKQVAMRRESELVYIQKTQDLEEEQPNVEQELRRLMEKPDHLKTAWERKKEEQLMAKLMEIVNDRNAIIEGLDEDRLREEEEDQELNKMMMNLNIKKPKTKKKSPVAKLFGWGNKKEA